MKNYYDILGIETNASFEEIKAAYKALVKKFHPDVNPQQREFFEKKSKSINEAYEILSNPSKKSSYDMRLKEFLNRQQSSQANDNYNRQKEEDLKRREEELRKRQNENDRRQREKEEELKRKQDDFDRKQREEELRKKQNENEKRQREKETDRKPIFIAIGIFLFLLVGFCMYKLVQDKTEFVDEAIVQADTVSVITMKEDLVVENAVNEETSTTIEENNSLIVDNSQQVEDEKQREKDKIKRKEEELKRKEAEEEKKRKLEEEDMKNISWKDLKKFGVGNKGYGYKHKKYEKVIISPQYDAAEEFYQGLAAVKRNGKWGFINEKGIEVISPSYDFVDNFGNDNMLRVENNGKYGFINRAGSVVIPLKYKYAEPFSDDLAKVNNVEFIDTSGNLIIKISDLSVSECSPFFSEGLLWVRREDRARGKDKYGFVNKKGQLVIDFIYSSAEDFSNGLSKVILDGDTQYRRFYINKQGKCVQDCP